MSKIQEKINQLRKEEFNLGVAIDNTEQNAGSGGQFLRFKNTTIYWHPVMGNEAHEVHGDILAKYLEMGGPGENPKTGKRDLGFPLTDITHTRVGNYLACYFEWGVIIEKDGNLAIFGDFFTAWKNADAEVGKFGYPLSEAVNLAGGNGLFFEYGCLWKGNYSKNTVAKIFFHFPKIGNPAFISTKNPVSLKQAIYVQIGISSISKNDFPPSFFTSLLNDRLFLVPSGRPFAQQASLVFAEEDTSTVNVLTEKYFRGRASVTSGAVEERTLYDIALKLPSGEMVCLAPHAVYFKSAWSDFGIMHATDIHVSQRLERFHAKLLELGHEEGAKAFNNYNDNFRDLIRQANKLHRDGKLDVIVATGDLVDYEFEYLPFKDDDNMVRLKSPSTEGDNFAFLERLIRGMAPSRDGKPNEELHIPILTTLGNHDYRAYKYLLNFEINILGADNPHVRNYSPYNLTENEANDLQEGFKSYSKETGVNMSKIDEDLNHYRKRFNHTGSFEINLGKHKILMLDTRWDKDMIDSGWDGFVHWLGYDSESSRNFADGNPDSQGMKDSQIALLQSALKESKGLLIIGMHAPPVNPKGNEYPHYFRETEHAFQKIEFSFDDKANDDISAYLWRNDRNRGVSAAQYKAMHKGWFDSESKAYFYKGKDVDDLLDYGIAKDKVKEFLRLCAGDGVTRKANLVLCGHIHKRAEFRIEWDDKKDEFKIYFDFYTENPKRYYASRKFGLEEPVLVEINDVVPVPSQKNPDIKIRKSAWGDYKVLQIPPYADPLDKAGNKTQWWDRHSPLILQTAAVGPIEANQRLRTIAGEKRYNPGPSFQGYRLITVKNDVISNIHYCQAKEQDSNDFLIPVLSVMMN
jgi:LGFP repeat/Calcineurin-like phosphoesterase